MATATSDASEVPKRVEEALFYRLKQKAFQHCDEKAKAYADCCRGRIVSLAWSCRKEAKELSACMNTYTSKLQQLKTNWVAAGSKHPMSETEWDWLLDNLLDDK